MKNTKIRTAIFYADVHEAQNLEHFGAKFLRNYKVFSKEISLWEYKNHAFFYINSGIGLINAAIFAQKIIAKFMITNIINYGACGANATVDFYKMKNQLIFPEKFYLLDVKTPWYPPGQLPYEPEFYQNNKIGKNSILGSSNSFIFKKEQVSEFTFVSFFDMEAFAFAQVSEKNNSNFYCIKYLTDQIENNSEIEEVNLAIKKGSKKAVKFVLELLSQL
ncbi:5'-methylthioadenosine nucleosidase / S-adenosylhomocysteine nucleosidase [Mesomycoplasma flocculare]|uniref:5'-methylthioadenosine/S-adenosylhomocysteine nucleosidase n=1 Tax=Mesomycoplasma flocculare ATCC 27399 TaxID=743971 RepID=A0A0A8E6X5_MESFC|nr:5'-methylthioadenosine nucleosidase / S-adenosylhomocysteine nucleosidase [Mesomycoplasma flocculare]AJC49758.1 5'-methylthioadenosine/S-adenosylhomocysteine nucleosidase [Mesomycoplasma flocculare ATCC 27399]AJC49769.1 5'-methylthioadenosine/S-adenosylhomocysteine nucleosidase [Mesomycoplasma flocculare ATCC 27399]ENX50751.1 5'-methylthioadenosine nucleosidase / S-adenosylhomocysteine nucleosidase [Mesomycoplasma flocculare ATCC 27716]